MKSEKKKKFIDDHPDSQKCVFRSEAGLPARAGFQSSAASHSLCGKMLDPLN